MPDEAGFSILIPNLFLHIWMPNEGVLAKQLHCLIEVRSICGLVKKGRNWNGSDYVCSISCILPCRILIHLSKGVFAAYRHFEMISRSISSVNHDGIILAPLNIISPSTLQT